MQDSEIAINNLIKMCNEQNKNSIIKSINLIIKEGNLEDNIKLVNIENINRKFFKENKKITTNNINFCTICHDNINKNQHKIELHKCNHVFHKKCLNKYLKKTFLNFSCPNCKKEYKSDLTNISTNIYEYK